MLLAREKRPPTRGGRGKFLGICLFDYLVRVS